MKNCAYCGHREPASKEHIWPSSLIGKYEGLKTYNPKNNKFYTGDPVIKDVCATCNNVRLSTLDSYLCSLYDKHFCNIIEPGDGARIEYNYDLLLRALLKISYNSSRAADNEKSKKLHAQFAKYILNGEYCRNLMLRLQIVTASKSINLEDRSEQMFRPELLRCAVVAYDGALSYRFLVRMVAINSFWFYIIIPYRNEAKHKWRDFLEGFCNWKTPPGMLVESHSSVLEIPVDKTTYMHPELLGSLLNAENA